MDTLLSGLRHAYGERFKSRSARSIFGSHVSCLETPTHGFGVPGSWSGKKKFAAMPMAA